MTKRNQDMVVGRDRPGKGKTPLAVIFTLLFLIILFLWFGRELIQDDGNKAVGTENSSAVQATKASRQ